MKTCSKCGERKPLEDFGKDKRRHDGRGSHCKTCHNNRVRELGRKTARNHVSSDDSGEKQCSVCGLIFPLADFPVRKDTASGRRSACQTCHRARSNEYSKTYRKWNPEKVREYARQYRENNQDRERARYRRYDEAHREKRRAAMASARATNPEYQRALRKAWREDNLEVVRERCRRYWHYRRTGSDPSVLVDAYAERLLELPCDYCGATENISIDHVVPISRGGKHVIENIVPACRTCNSSKGAKLLDEWLGSQS